jgi:predicted lipoprotein with Yx(FWY)xxD motif
VIDAMSVGLLGSALVNGSGRTLYTLSADRAGKVTCTSSACTSAWPPVLLSAGEHVTAGSGVDSSKLGTVKTPSGALQVTYNHWPLYTFSGDSGAGQTSGQGINSFGGVWHPIAPTGQPIVGGPSSTPTSSGYGY